MSEVRVRKLDDWVVSWFRAQAKHHGSSLEGELRRVLTEAALAKKRAITDDMRSQLDVLRKKYGTFSDSAIGIREDRDRRG
jgi:plasmid stability protein